MLNSLAFSKSPVFIYLLIVSLLLRSWSASSFIGIEITLSNDRPQDLLSDWVKYFPFVVPAQKLVDGGESTDMRLLKDPQGNCDVLEILSTCRDWDIDGLEFDIIDDWFLFRE